MGVKVNQRAVERREEGNNDTENERWVSTFHTFQRWICLCLQQAS